MNDFKIESIGKLMPHPDIPDEWLISDPIPIPFFEGKEIKFTFNCDLESDTAFLTDVNQSIISFLKMNLLNRERFTSQVYENYKEIQAYYKSELYIELIEEKDIWKYVYPQEIIICSGNDQDKNVYVLVICGCEWEEEHGLQLAFRTGTELIRVSSIDYSPTN